MLVVTLTARKDAAVITLHDGRRVVVSVSEVRRNGEVAALGVQASRDVPVFRSELLAARPAAKPPWED